MLYLKTFGFNPFQQNTYLLYDDQGEAFIIDPGNYNSSEDRELKSFVEEKKLKLSRLLLTHAHLDHVFGNRYIKDTWGLLPEVHQEDVFFVSAMKRTADMYGMTCEPSPEPVTFLSEGQSIQLGNYELTCIHTPGHSPGSISFYIKSNRLLLSGDVLFHESIGRTDLPKGDHASLLRSIREKLFPLGDDVKVYSGHGPPHQHRT